MSNAQLSKLHGMRKGDVMNILRSSPLEWTLAGLAEEMNVPIGCMCRPLSELLRDGLIIRRRDREGCFYQVAGRAQ